MCSRHPVSTAVTMRQPDAAAFANKVALSEQTQVSWPERTDSDLEEQCCIWWYYS